MSDTEYLVESPELVLERRVDGSIWLRDAGDNEEAWENCIRIEPKDLETIRRALVESKLVRLFGERVAR